MTERHFKAAFATSDGVKISKHFGRAEFFEIIEINEDKIISRERRANTGAHQHHEHEHGSMHHDMNHKHHERHNQMAEIIKDCDYVIAGGMGTPIYNALTRLEKKVIVTSLNNIDEALLEISSGKIVNHTEKLH